MVVLVTGGSGFIGTWVLRQLRRLGHRAVVFDVRPAADRWKTIIGADFDATFVPGDLADRGAVAAAMDKHDVTHVIHLGALLTPACQSDPWLGCQVNVMGSMAIFESVRERADRIQGIAYASSLAVFGSPDDRETAAYSEFATPSFYGAFKRSVELIAEQYWRHCEIPSFGLRPHIVYGPERIEGLTAGPSLAARAAARGESFTIPYTGQGGYDFVEDVAAAFVRGAVDSLPGANVVDLPSEQATPEEIVETLTRIVPESTGKLKVSGDPIPPNVSHQSHVISSLFEDWAATPLAAGLQRTVDFYR